MSPPGLMVNWFIVEQCFIYKFSYKDGTVLKTDTHWRSMNGKGSYNWRMVFPVTFPMKSHRIAIQAWDADLLSSSDYIAEATLDFTKEAKEAFMYDQSVKVFN